MTARRKRAVGSRRGAMVVRILFGEADLACGQRRLPKNEVKISRAADRDWRQA